ncbi:MAG: M1 family metallopeptidase, partial [Microthrixaceae bacterium]
MSSEPDAYRLSTTVRPLHYELAMEVDPDSEGFSGRVAIELEFSEPTARFAVHSLDLDWSTVRLELAEPSDAGVVREDGVVRRDGVVREVDVVGTVTDTEAEWTVVELAGGVPAGRATLHVEYRGSYNPNLVGLYTSEFEHDGVTTRLAVTQCESTHARRILPCFDEPEFKATFGVTLVVPEDATAVSNGAEVSRERTGDRRSEVRFAPTMLMSSYLLAFVVGPLEVTLGPPVSGRNGDIALRVVHPPGKEDLTAFALEVANAALTFYEDYYDLAYPGDKVDLVAIPDFAFGAMENMGCITFREVLLLVDPDTATPMELQRVADVINHELAHMWFGNLVTMKWWNGIWLNEAFATFMEISASDAFRPEWDVWTTFGLARAAAFETDALWNTRPIEFEVRTAA